MSTCPTWLKIGCALHPKGTAQRGAMDGGAAQPLAPLWPRKAGQSKLLTASMTSEAPMRARPYAESAAPPFLLPPKLNTVTPRVIKPT